MRHRRFAALCREDRKALRAASAILRIADALDYRHKGAVEEVRVSLRRHAGASGLLRLGTLQPRMPPRAEEGRSF